MAGKDMKHESRNAAWTLGKWNINAGKDWQCKKRKWYPDEAENGKKTHAEYLGLRGNIDCLWHGKHSDITQMPKAIF